MDRVSRWSPTGPCPILPGNCAGLPWNETRTDVPKEPWIENITSWPVLTYVTVQLFAFLACTYWFVRFKYSLMCCPRLKRKQNQLVIELESLSSPLMRNEFHTSEPPAGTTENSIEDGRSTTTSTVKSGRINMVGYKQHVLGSIAYSLTIVWAVLLLIAYCINLYGQYYGCQWKWPDALCVLGDFRVMGDYRRTLYAQFVIWSSFVLLYGFLVYLKRKKLNLFSVACRLEEAEFVSVTKETVYSTEKNTITNDLPISFLKPLLAAYHKIFPKDLQERRHMHRENCVVNFTATTNSPYIEFQCERYLWDDDSASFQLQRIDDNLSNGLSSADVVDRMNRIGRNVIGFEIGSFLDAVIEEFVTFTYLYQFLIYCWWVYGMYWHVGVIFICICVGSGMTKVFVRRKAKSKIYDMTRMDAEVCVFRDDEWIFVDAKELVPGDMVNINGNSMLKGNSIPADMVLVSGNIVCDESGLTGEPMPINKTPIGETPRESIENWEQQKQGRRNKYAFKSDNLLFAGCRVLQIGNANTRRVAFSLQSEDEAYAVVLKTGITTTRGRLIQDILYSLPVSYQWDSDLGPVSAMLFILGLIYGTLGVTLQVSSGTEIPSRIISFETLVWLLSQMMSPAIPLALIVGQIASARRLKKLFSIDVKEPDRIAIAGKVQTVCFDKTGTITKDGLDFSGVHTAAQNQFESDTAALSPHIVKGMASCHSLAMLGGSFVGPQVEIEMFKNSHCNLSSEGKFTRIQSKDGKHDLQVLKKFKFDHRRMTMSVVVQDNVEQETMAYVKGAPEVILKLCKTSSIPPDIEKRLAEYSLHGNYVLALSSKQCAIEAGAEELDRDAVESELTFLCLILFRNEIKPSSPSAFAKLREGGIECIMVTGDNAMCGKYIAEKCQIFPSGSSCLLGDVYPGGNDVRWHMMGNLNEKCKKYISTTEVLDLAKSHSLAVTGKAFERLKAESGLSFLLSHIHIYARMSPDNKKDLVQLLMNSGRIVGMVGDGGNDCGALRAAHMGLALSDSDASIVAPFTSAEKSLLSVVNLLLEGRCALANSFASYKFLIAYGQLFALVKMAGYAYATYMFALAYIMIDGVFVIGISTLMTYAEPKTKLTIQLPTASLLSYETVASILKFHVVSVVSFSLGFLIWIFDNGYHRHPTQHTIAWQVWAVVDSYEGGFFFIFFCMRLFAAALTFSLGQSFRAPIWKNMRLVLFISFFFVLISWLMMAPVTIVTKWFHMPSENFNRPDTDRITWIMYHKQDPTAADKNGGITLMTRFLILGLFILSGFIDVKWA